MVKDNSLRETLSQMIDKRMIAAVFLPAILMQSVVMGGGFATGREIMTYHGKFGALGLVSLVITALFIAVFLSLVFEFARVTESYNYRKFTENLLGKFWPIFEILYLILAVVSIAVIIDAGGNIIETVTGVPRLGANIAIVLLVATILYFGESLIETVSIYGTVVIYLTFFAMFSIAMLSRWNHMVEVIAGNTYSANGTFLNAIYSGLIYGGLTIPFWIPALFTTERFRSRKESIYSGVIGGVMMFVPLLLSHLAFMGYYPNQEIISAPVPWLPVLQNSGGGFLLILYGITISWTLMETPLGFIHSITDRLDESISNVNVIHISNKDELSRTDRGIIAVAIFIGAFLLSQYGIIALVNQGYRLLATAFIVVVCLPLLSYYIRNRNSSPTASMSD